MTASQTSKGLNPQEIRDVLGLSVIFGLRLFGLFLLLPVLSPFARSLPGATPFLAGLAVGAYGLSQCLLQLPVGMLSDRWGRLPVISAGLIVYTIGCLIAAQAHSISGLIFGRLIQGSGAIASVVVSMVADLTRDEVRARAMALIGMSVGLAFVVGFLLGPLIAGRWGVRVLFWGLAGFDLAALLYLWAGLSEPRRHARTDLSLAHLKQVLADRNLLSLDVFNFCLHCGLTATFVVTPFALREGFGASGVWKVYLAMIVVSGLVMVPALWYAEKRKRTRELLFWGLAAAAAGCLLLSAFPSGLAFLVAGLIVFFVGFNLQEPTLPALVTRFAPTFLRGTAVGAFNMSQFLGSFAGGAMGGYFLGRQPASLFLVLPFLSLTAALAAWVMDNPRHIRVLRLETRASWMEARHALRALPVYDVRPIEEGRLEVRYASNRVETVEIERALAARGLAFKEIK